MSKKKIVVEPDPILRKKSEPIEKVDTEVRKLMDDMLETMYAAPGIGLAAVQIGIPKRIVVIDVSKEKSKKDLYCLINPVIKKFSNLKSSYEEGCLSIPDTFIEIERPKEIELEYIDQDGKKKELKCDGLLSTCAQHELQHCDGKLIIDFLSKLKKDLIIKKLSKQKKTEKIIV